MNYTNIAVWSFVTLSVQAQMLHKPDIVKHLAAQEQRIQQAKQVLQTVPFTQPYNYLITWYEWQELNMDEYVRLYNYTQTAFGSWGLQQLTKPITDYHVLHERQESIKLLEQSPTIYTSARVLLDDIKRHEESLLASYQERDELNIRAQQLYYTLFNTLNTSKLALDVGYATELFSSAANLVTLLCISSLAAEIICAQVEGRSVRVLDGLGKGLGHLITYHTLGDSAYQLMKAKNKFALPASEVAPIAIIHDGLWSLICQSITAGAATIAHCFKQSVALFTKPASIQVLMQGSFGDKWSFYNHECHLPTLASLCLVAGQVAYLDQTLYMRLRQNYRRLTFLFYTYNALQKRYVALASMFNSVRELLELAQEIPALACHPAIKRAWELCTQAQSPCYQLLQQLQLSTYQEEHMLCYSRGQLLITHALLKKHLKDIVPIIQAVGIIDGFMSIGHTYQVHMHKNEKRFCFAHLRQTQEPFVHIQDAWLPLIEHQHVPNSCALGQEYIRNLLITGPNGGGKSSFLKLVGGITVLAHSWTIVPAVTCSMSSMHGLRTSFNPQEDIKKGISTFMAQKERLELLNRYAKTEHNQGCCMLLVDEPYRGTIEAEAELRSYQFCKEIAQHAHCMLIVASHLKKPMQLAQETKLFVNKQFEVAAHDDGAFKRTFKLVDDAAWWWFDDVHKRMLFVDWLAGSN